MSLPNLAELRKVDASSRIPVLTGKLQRMSKKKNPAAVALGRRGGKARSKKLGKKQRKEIARLGGRARWAKAKHEEK